jgi:crotonobetaine/carnitine-CoA ligase
MLPFVMAQAPSELDRAHKLKRIQCAPSPAAYAREFEQRFGVGNFVEAFGMTEICVPIISPQGVPKPTDACGLLNAKWFDLRIVDPETDEELPDGEVGEAVVRSKEPWILNAGYIGMPEATLNTWRNLWFHTGDALKRDSDGWYYYIDRIKDSIRRRGENISSYEIETAIRSHPAVLEVAAVAVPADQQGGEDEVMVFVVPQDSKLDPAELIKWCEPAIPAFAVPRYVRIIDALPKTPSEKVRKAALRDIGVDGSTWDRLKQDKHSAARMTANPQRRSDRTIAPPLG